MVSRKLCDENEVINTRYKQALHLFVTKNVTNFTARNCSEGRAHVTHAYFPIFHHSANQMSLLLTSSIVKLSRVSKWKTHARVCRNHRFCLLNMQICNALVISWREFKKLRRLLQRKCHKNKTLRFFHAGGLAVQNRWSALSLTWYEWFSC